MVLKCSRCQKNVSKDSVIAHSCGHLDHRQCNHMKGKASKESNNRQLSRNTKTAASNNSHRSSKVSTNFLNGKERMGEANLVIGFAWVAPVICYYGQYTGAAVRSNINQGTRSDWSTPSGITSSRHQDNRSTSSSTVPCHHQRNKPSTLSIKSNYRKNMWK